MKTNNQLIQELQQAQRDTTSQLKKYKEELTMIIERERKVAKQELAATNEELRATKQNFQAAQKETKNELAKMTKSLVSIKSTQEEAKKTMDDLTASLRVTKQETKKKIDELTQKLTHTERDLKQQLATACQNSKIAERRHDEVLEKQQAKITEIETVTQKRTVELERKLSTLLHCTNVNTKASKLLSGDQDVPVIVKMSDYSKKKRDKVEWYSDTFYTHYKGYKMCLHVYPDGYVSSYMLVMCTS